MNCVDKVLLHFRKQSRHPRSASFVTCRFPEKPGAVMQERSIPGNEKSCEINWSGKPFHRSRKNPVNRFFDVRFRPDISGSFSRLPCIWYGISPGLFPVSFPAVATGKRKIVRQKTGKPDEMTGRETGWPAVSSRQGAVPFRAGCTGRCRWLHVVKGGGHVCGYRSSKSGCAGNGCRLGNRRMDRRSGRTGCFSGGGRFRRRSRIGQGG